MSSNLFNIPFQREFEKRKSYLSQDIIDLESEEGTWFRKMETYLIEKNVGFNVESDVNTPFMHHPYIIFYGPKNDYNMDLGKHYLTEKGTNAVDAWHVVVVRLMEMLEDRVKGCEFEAHFL
ncbi:MAG: hypothetical protein N4A41_00445 [Crocinitomicaceae bacterium]|jgi:hypothetical protein|nr:hypothetical protein [Crocinitomicaceae bacterium]